MSISRRTFSGNALALAFASALLGSDEALAVPGSGMAFSEEAPHDAYEFWNGFFNSVNMSSPDYQKGARAGTAGLADPAAETQYLHYKAEAQQLRYATDITQNELLDHDGDVSVGIQLSKFRSRIRDRQVKKSAVAHRRYPDPPLYEPSRAPCLDCHRFS